MKARTVIVVVVLTHVFVIGSVLCMQGCRTKGPGVIEPPPSPVLPPRPEEAVQPVSGPLFQPPAPVQPVPAVAAPLGGQTYKVQPGDSLSKIAVRAGVSVRELIELNNIKDPNKIRVGQTLVLPDYAKPVAGGAAAVPATRVTPKKPAIKAESVRVPEGGTVYVVVAGDSLSKIAAKHRVKIADLRAANKLSGDKILVGQKLIIPGQGTVTAETKLQKKETHTVASAAAPGFSTPAALPPQPAMPVSEMAPTAGQRPATAFSATPAAPVAVEPHVYTAMEGDTVESVAKTFLLSVDELMALNNFTSPQQKLTPGQKVLIPVGQP